MTQLYQPPLDGKFIEWLDKSYPERSPRLHQTDRELWMEAGARHLVNRLVSLYNKQQQEEDLNLVSV